MRVIAGERKGMPLEAPKGADTRPTQAKTRESLFSILQAYVPDADVLDLFAGSGALALEALSRGARTAALADVSREAAACARRNVERLRYQDRARLYACDWKLALGRMAADELRFDLVFLDPPYRMGDLGAVCAALADAGLLLSGAMLALECAEDVPQSPDGRFSLFKSRTYGDTRIDFFLYEGGEGA